MKQNEKDALIQAQREEIMKAQAKLTSLDYIGVKIATGVATISDYKDEIAEAEACREAIRKANARIAELEATEVEAEEHSEE